jgi:hypothetical protein
MSFNPFGAAQYTLQSSISSTQTTITLSSFTEPVSGVPYTMALINSDIVYATIAPKTSSSEFISFTGITQNSNGTATLTGVTRGLSKKFPFTESTTFKLPHAGQSVFIISDVPQLFTSYAALDNDNIFTGQNEVPIPLDDADIANKGYVDALVNGGTVSNNRIVVAGVSGETVALGNLVYFKESDGFWWLTDADTASTINNVQLGIAQGAGTAGNNITNGVLTFGVDINNTGTAGAFAYAGNTAGAISGTVGTNPRVIGQYLPSLAGLYFNPNYQNILTNYAVDAVGTDSYAITLPEAFDAYFAGMTISFKAGTANTGACTLDVNGLGAKDIRKNVDLAMATGDILANQIVTVIYDGTNFQVVSPSSLFPGDFGDGSDGDVTISSPTTLTRDMYYNNLVVSDVLSTGGYRIFVKGTVSGSGTIQNVGNAGSIGVGSNAGAGAGATTGYFSTTAGSAGANGATGTPGAASSSSAQVSLLSTTASSVGGTGGNGNNTGGAGGSSGTRTGVLTRFGVVKFQTAVGVDINAAGAGVKVLPSMGGTGGGGGGGNGSNAGGGGGGGGASGGIVALFAYIWSGTFTISCQGGAGGGGGTGTAANCGGGGGGAGGNGGYIYTVYNTKTWTGSYTLTGGTGGTGGPGGGGTGVTGATGATGSVGVSKEIQVSALF